MAIRTFGTLLISLWWAILSSSGAALLYLERDRSERREFTIPIQGECLRLCSDNYDQKLARCRSLPTRSREKNVRREKNGNSEKNACLTQANQERFRCRYGCAEPR